MLSKIFSNITYEYKIEMHNVTIFLLAELLTDLSLKSVEKSNLVLWDETVRKAVSFKRKPPQPFKPQQQWS